jgi:hypothetical protein
VTSLDPVCAIGAQHVGRRDSSRDILSAIDYHRSCQLGAAMAADLADPAEH